MLSALSEVLPFALGVAASALAVVALILILQGRRALVSGMSFTVGWLAGVGVVFAAGVVFGLAISDDPARWTQWLKALLGALLLVAAVRKWHQRAPSGQEPTAPAWMEGLQDSAPGKAAVLGFLLGGINAGSTRNVVKQLQLFVRPPIERALERRNADRSPRRKITLLRPRRPNATFETQRFVLVVGTNADFRRANESAIN